mgnify:CR=1 FL=1
MAISVKDLLDGLREEITDVISPWVYKIVCSLPQEYQRHFDRVLLAGIYVKLSELTRASAFGQNGFNIRPVMLGTTPIKLVERNNQNLVRKVTIWVDAASGGPTPTIRLSTSGTTSASGGIRVNAGQANAIGEVPPNQELWGSASTSIAAYVVEVS